MISKILIVLALLAGALLIAVSLQPAEFRVIRTTVISAPPAAVFAHVNDFHAWEAWSPWAKLDPAMQQSFAGPAAGTGAIYTWVGNNKVGAGRMTLTDPRGQEAPA